MAQPLVETIKDIIVIITPVISAWILYKQTQIDKKQTEQTKTVQEINTKTDDQTVKIDKLKEQTDGNMTKLLEATQGRFQAEGELKGQADQKIISEKEAALKVTIPGDNDAVIDVNIVAQKDPVAVKIDDQTKPVDVKVTKEIKKP